MPFGNTPGFSAGGPPTQQEQIEKIFEKLTPVVGSLSHLNTSLKHLSNNLNRMAELSARANAALLLLVGLPRIFRSDLYHMVAYGAGGSRTLGGMAGKVSAPTRIAQDFASSGSGGGYQNEELSYQIRRLKEQLTAAVNEAKELKNTIVNEVRQAGVDVEQSLKGKQKEGPLGLEEKRTEREKRLDEKFRFKTNEQLEAERNRLRLIQEGRLKDEDDMYNDPQKPPVQGTYADKKLLNRLNNINEIQAELDRREKNPLWAYKPSEKDRNLSGIYQVSTYTPGLDLGDAGQLGRGVQGMPGGWRPPGPELKESKWFKNKWAADRMAGSTGPGILNAAQYAMFGTLDSFQTAIKRASVGLQKFIQGLARTTNSPEQRQFLLGINQFLRKGFSLSNILGGIAGFGQKLAMPTLYGGAMAGTLLSSASPDSFSTLTGSVKLLAVALGGALIPMALDMALALQTFAFAVKEGKAEWAKLIVKVLGWATAIGGVVVVLGMLANAVRALLPAISAVGKGMLAMNGALLILTAGVYLVIEAYSRQADKHKDRISALEEQAAGGMADYEELPDDIKKELDDALSVSSPNARNRMLESLADKYIKKAEDQKAFQDEFQNKTSGLTGEGATAAWLGALGINPQIFGKEAMQAQGWVNRTANEIGKAITGNTKENRVLDAINKGAEGGKDPQTVFTGIIKDTNRQQKIAAFLKRQAELDDAKNAGKDISSMLTPKEKEKRGNQMNQLLLALTTVKGQAQYTSIEEAHRRTQVAAAGSDPLTIMIEKWQQENFREMIKQTKLLNESGGYLSNIANSIVR